MQSRYYSVLLVVLLVVPCASAQDTEPLASPYFEPDSLVSSYSVTPSDPRAPDTSYYYHHEPWPLPVGRNVITAGLLLTMLPGPLVEDEIPVPAVELQLRRGLAPNISMIASISTNVVSTIANLGAQWNAREGRFSWGVGANALGFLGWLSIEGQFDNNVAFAIAVLPYLKAGFRFDDFSVSSTFAASYSLYAGSDIADSKTEGPTGSWNDFYYAIAFEQPFLSTMRVSFGMSVMFSRTPYQSWITYNTIDQYMFLPSFFFGIQV